MDITQILLLFGAFQGLFLGIVLLWKKQSRKDNIFLASLLTLIAFQTYLLSIDKLYDQLGCAIVHMFSRLVFLLYGPLIYFYIRSLIDRTFSWKNQYYWHLLPFVFFSICSIISYQNWGDNNFEWLHYIANTHYFFPVFYELLRLGYLLVYIVFAIKWLNYYREKSQMYFSNSEQIQIDWLYQFSSASFLLWLIVAFGLRFNFYDGNPHSNTYQSIFFVLPIFIYWVSFKALRHPMLFAKIALSEEKQQEEKTAEAVSENNGKYQRSGLKSVDATRIKQQLDHLMDREKPFLSPNLKLKDLAGLLSVNPHHLSQVLNEQMDGNFYQFINSYRIEAAKRNLLDPVFQHYTIEAIAFESGFSSKSTFNSLFKKKVGQTPGQWRKSGLSGNWNTV